MLCGICQNSGLSCSQGERVADMGASSYDGF